MTLALAFDIYGTLIDPHGVVGKLEDYVAERAVRFSELWRGKQLEYTWRRGLMRSYQDFGVCTRQALDYADAQLQTGLSVDAKRALMHAYRELPAYADVAVSLEMLKNAEHRLYPFSNGTADMVQAVLVHAGIDHFFEEVISVDSLRTYKPDPAVYHFVSETAQLALENCWLVSSNGFDVIGAVSAGMKAAWLKRVDSIIFDPWETEPTQVISRLDELAEKISAHIPQQ